MATGGYLPDHVHPFLTLDIFSNRTPVSLCISLFALGGDPRTAESKQVQLVPQLVARDALTDQPGSEMSKLLCHRCLRDPVNMTGSTLQKCRLGTLRNNALTFSNYCAGINGLTGHQVGTAHEHPRAYTALGKGRGQGCRAGSRASIMNSTSKQHVDLTRIGT